MGEYNDETEEEICSILRALRAPISSSTKKLRGSRPDPTHNPFFFWLRYFFSFSSSCTEEREELADLDRCEGKKNEDKEEERDEEEELYAGVKDGTFFLVIFGQDNFFIFAEKMFFVLVELQREMGSLHTAAFSR